jgi:endonuclease G
MNKHLLLTFLLCLFSFFAHSQDNSNLLLGNPSNAKSIQDSAKNYLYDQGYFIESYNSVNSEPNWVSWHLDASDIGNPEIRLNNFRYDFKLPFGWFQVQPMDYKDTGFDQGHHCNSGDRSANHDENSATFVETNMAPQAPRNNRILWKDLEDWTRSQISQNMEAYIIMGSYGIGGTGSNGYQKYLANGKLVVPARFWKIIILIPVGDNDLSRINANTEIVCVDTPNDNNLDTDWRHDQVDAAEIEHVTGYHFFTNLPAGIAEILRNKKVLIPE